MPVINDGQCEFTWNPGEWPYVTRCTGRLAHESEHIDAKGRRHLDTVNAARQTLDALTAAVGQVLNILESPSHRGPSLHRDKCRTLAMEWPALAAALGGLLEAYDRPVPAPLRQAMRVIAAEEAKSRG